MYSKEYIMVDGLPDGETTVMVYTMNSVGIYPPSGGYFAGVKQGYKDFDLPIKPLIVALEQAYDDKKPSHVERQRARRNGRPQLAARPSIVALEDKSPKQRKKERKAAKRAKRKAAREYVRHDPWAGTYGARPGRERMSLDKWLEEKYYGGERF
jgi:hypothetical protein